MATYLHIKDVKGNVSNKNYKNWIEIQSLSFSINRHISTLPGRVYDRELSHPNFSECQLTKHMDNSSISLFELSCSAKIIGSIKIDLCQTNQSLHPYAQIELSNLIITSYHLTQDSIDKLRPLESLQINYEKISFRYTPYSKNNTPESPMTAGFDLKKAELI